MFAESLDLYEPKSKMMSSTFLLWRRVLDTCVEPCWLKSILMGKDNYE
jgi:hypothetical protein